jgi:hypothetical protein
MACALEQLHYTARGVPLLVQQDSTAALKPLPVSVRDMHDMQDMHVGQWYALSAICW